MAHELDPNALVGQTLGKKFLVRRWIGGGGMGRVYEVEHVLTRRTGALKLLHPRFAAVPEVVARFVREASVAGRIGNSHIVETIDAGELPSGEPYLFMELLSGESLRERLRGTRLPCDVALRIVDQAAKGLAAAHAAGIVHRDVKPDNLFLCEGEPTFVKILDFGISKFSETTGDQRLTKEGAPMGTPYYMSPEQVVAHRDVDARSDIYSLGVVLYECFAGRVPFEAETLSALCIKIFEGVYAPLGRIVSDMPDGLEGVVNRALAVDPQRRYASMEEFRDALHRVSAQPGMQVTHPLVLAPAPREASKSPATPGTLEDAASRAGSRSRRTLALSLLAGGAIAVAPIVFLFARSREDVDARLSEPLVEKRARTSSSTSAPQAAPDPKSVDETRNEVAAPAPSSARSQPSPSASSTARARRTIGTGSARAISRAAADGLSERNPFVEAK